MSHRGALLLKRPQNGLKMNLKMDPKSIKKSIQNESQTGLEEAPPSYICIIRARGGVDEARSLQSVLDSFGLIFKLISFFVFLKRSQKK